jgi:DNA polymerase-1
MAQARLLLVDGHSFAYRAFFAIQRLSNSKGQPTNAVYGFAKMVRKLIQDHQPTHAAVVMDLGEPVKRLEKLGVYKAQRKPMPDDLKSQIPLIHEFASVSRIPLIEKDGIEADDIIATLAVQANASGISVAIATSDKDFMQLVGDSIYLLNPAANEAKRIDAEAVRARYGVAPNQIIDLLSLRGDSIDNIPGVPGVGPKTAASLLQQFGSLDQLYLGLEQVSDPKLRQKLLEHKDQIQLNRELVRLDTGLSLQVTPDQLALGHPDYSGLIAFCERMEFRTLREEIQRDSLKESDAELTLGL